MTKEGAQATGGDGLPERIALAWGAAGLRVQSAGLHHPAYPNRVRRRVSDTYRFWHVLEGAITSDFGSGPLRLEAGTAIILPPQRGLLAQEEAVAGRISVLMADFQIIVHPPFPNPLLLLLLPTPVPARDAAGAAALCRTMGDIGGDWASDWETRINLRPHLDLLLTAHLRDGFAQGCWRDRGSMPDWLMDLSARCGRQIVDPALHAGNLHRLVGRSREHVARSLQRHLGMGTAAFLRQQRVELAGRLLAQDGMAVAEVAARVGYRDASLFARHFRMVMGATPSAWRHSASGRHHR